MTRETKPPIFFQTVIPVKNKRGLQLLLVPSKTIVSMKPFIKVAPYIYGIYFFVNL